MPAHRCAEVGTEVQKKKKNPKRMQSAPGAGRAAGAWEAARAPSSCLPLSGRQQPPSGRARKEAPARGRKEPGLALEGTGKKGC